MGPAQEKKIHVGGPLQQEVPVRNITFIIGRNYQILAALALIRAGDTHVVDEALPSIVDLLEVMIGFLESISCSQMAILLGALAPCSAISASYCFPGRGHSNWRHG